MSRIEDDFDRLMERLDESRKMQFVFKPLGGAFNLARQIFISTEEAMRRTPESEEDETPKIRIVNENEMKAEELIESAKAFEKAGSPDTSTRLRVRALCVATGLETPDPGGLA